MNRKWIVGLIVMAVGIAAWLVGSADAPVTDEILLGYLHAGSGRWATISATNLVAAQMAVDEVNAAGGIAGKPLRVIIFDTGGEPDQAVVGMRKLVGDDRVLAVIGPFSSSECRVVFPAGERAGVVSMSMASSAPNIAEPYRFAFRNTMDESVMFEQVMRALADHDYPAATGAVAYATDDVVSKVLGETILPDLMRQSGAEVRLSVTFQTQAFDLAPQVSQLMSNPTDLIGVGSGPEAATRLVREMRRQGHAGRLVGGSTISDPELGERMGAAGDGTTIPVAFYAELNDRTRDFEAEFLTRVRAAGIVRSAAAQFDAATYDIVLIYAAAMKNANVTGDPANLAAERSAIRDEIEAMRDFPALAGPTTFGENGDAVKPVYVVELNGGRWTLLGSYAANP